MREADIPEIRASARLYRHDATGAELLSLAADDENKVFGITFRTPPSDSTGVAHILEHSVLCGSDKYPVKEPFVELLKGSLQTFLNAFTYPDKTCYPVASQNLKDFYNLIDIYMDAALHPLLSRHTHQQEAWHYELEKAEGPLTYKGVVFNEMKGVYASPESVLAEYSQRTLFPDTTYGVDYGGDPRKIPDLTWEQLRAFHETYYHPSNARIYFYGDDPEEERLRRMDAYLKGYEAAEIDSAIKTQPPWNEPKRVRHPYQAAPGGESGTFVTVNWMLTDITDITNLLGWSILSHILTGTPASPLRKALLDSGLGEDIAGVGFESQMMQPFYSTGLKGVKAGNENGVEDLIFKTLRQLVKQRLDRETIDASVNTVEFGLREGNTGSYPRGLALMLGSLQTWLYGGDPMAPLMFDKPLAAIKKAVEDGEPFFENLMASSLLDNPHRTTLMLYPDPELRARLEEEEQGKLANVLKGLSEEERKAMIEQTGELHAAQEAPDSPENLASIPQLALEDLEREAKPIPSEVVPFPGIDLLYHDVSTRGIVYFDIGFDLSEVPQDWLPLVPVWARVLLESGTRDLDFVELSQRIGTVTGGIDPETYTSMHTRNGTAQTWMFLRGKSVEDRFGDMLSIFVNVFESARWGARDRVRQIVLEEKSDMEADIIPSGHRMVGYRLRAWFNPADWANEQMNGITYYHAMKRLLKDIDENWDSVEERLRGLTAKLIARRSMIFNLTCDDAFRNKAEKAIVGIIGDIPQAMKRKKPVPMPHQQNLHIHEGLTIPSQVNYVGKAVNLYDHGYELHGSALTISRYIRNAWLWDQVRVQGGAYGGFCGFDYRSGMMTFVSYRDPNLKRTLDIYDRTSDFLRELKLSEPEQVKSIVGAVGDLDSYLFPDAKGMLGLTRHLTGDSDENRRQIRESVFDTRLEHYHQFGDALACIRDKGTICVIGSADLLAREAPDFRIQAVISS